MEQKQQYRKNKIKWSFLILFAFSFIYFKGTVFAGTVYTEGDYYYRLEDDAIVITGYFGSDREITLPSRIAGYPVSVIATGAFQNTTVKVINLPDTIMTLEKDAIASGIIVNYPSGRTEQPETEPGQAEETETGMDEINGEDALENESLSKEDLNKDAETGNSGNKETEKEIFSENVTGINQSEETGPEEGEKESEDSDNGQTKQEQNENRKKDGFLIKTGGVIAGMAVATGVVLLVWTERKKRGKQDDNKDCRKGN